MLKLVQNKYKFYKLLYFKNNTIIYYKGTRQIYTSTVYQKLSLLKFYKR